MVDDDSTTIPTDLASQLGLPRDAQPRLDVMPAPDVQLPDDASAERSLQRCGVGADDRAAMLAARPDPATAWWWLLRGTVGELRSRMDNPLPADGYVSWPTIPEAAGPIGMFLYAWALLAVEPDLRAVHRRRGIAPAVSTAAVADFGGLMEAHQQVTGVRGVGLFPLWGPPQSFCGIDLTIGRHSFTRTVMAFGDGPAGYVLQVHIPPTGPLDMDESEASIRRALQFFGEHYRDEPISALVCKSWMLDPQLREYLPPAANILRFQAGWDLIPRVPLDDAWEGDREMLRLGLHVRTPDSGALTAEHLALVPDETTLQRAFVSHIKGNNHWYKRTGVRWLLER